MCRRCTQREWRQLYISSARKYPKENWTHFSLSRQRRQEIKAISVIFIASFFFTHTHMCIHRETKIAFLVYGVRKGSFLSFLPLQSVKRPSIAKIRFVFCHFISKPPFLEPNFFSSFPLSIKRRNFFQTRIKRFKRLNSGPHRLVKEGRFHRVRATINGTYATR